MKSAGLLLLNQRNRRPAAEREDQAPAAGARFVSLRPATATHRQLVAALGAGPKQAAQRKDAEALARGPRMVQQCLLSLSLQGKSETAQRLRDDRPMRSMPSIVQRQPDDDEPAGGNPLPAVGKATAAISEPAGQLDVLATIAEPLVDEVPLVGQIAGLSGGVNDAFEAARDFHGSAGGAARAQHGAKFVSGMTGAASTAAGLVETVPDDALGWAGPLGAISGGAKALSSASAAFGAQQQASALGALEQGLAERGGSSAAPRTAGVMADRARGRRNQALASTASAAVETVGALGVLPGADKAAKLFDAGWLGWAARGIGSTLAPGLIDSNAQAEKATKHAAAVGRMQNMVLPTQVVVGAFRNKLEGDGAAEISALYQAAVSAGETNIAKKIVGLLKVWPNEAKEKSSWSREDKRSFAERRASLLQALEASG